MDKEPQAYSSSDEVDPNDRREIYDLNDVEHEVVAKYKPQYLASGGEHVVYTVEGHPNTVVKGDMQVLRQVIKRNIENEMPINDLPEEIKNVAQRYIRQNTVRYGTMRKFFGNEHVPAQKETFIKVPVTQEIFDELTKEFSKDGKGVKKDADEAWTIVRFQERVKEVSDLQHHSLVCGYAENQSPDKKLYEELTEELVFGKDSGKELTPARLGKIQKNFYLKELLDEAHRDSVLKEKLRGLIGKVIDYADSEGEILDLAGQDNLIFSKLDGEWDYKIIDARYPNGANILEKVKTALDITSSGERLNREQKSNLKNVLNFVRTINGLAQIFGVKKRINIAPAGFDSGKIDFLEALKSTL